MRTFTVLAIFLTVIFITGNEAHKLSAKSSTESGSEAQKQTAKSGTGGGSEAQKQTAKSGTGGGSGGNKNSAQTGTKVGGTGANKNSAQAGTKVVATTTAPRPSNPKATQAPTSAPNTTPQSTSPSPSENESGEESSHGHKGIFHPLKSLFGAKGDALESKGSHLKGGVSSAFDHVASKVDGFFEHLKFKGHKGSDDQSQDQSRK